MKRVITIVIIVVLAVGFGFFLYKMSPQTPVATSVDFNLSDLPELKQPRNTESDDHILGNPQAKNTIVAYEDIQCPACAQFEPTLKALPSVLEDTKVVFRHFPLLSLHKNAAVAALASEAASAQGKFWEFSQIAYDSQTQWSTLSDPVEKFVEYASAAGVADVEKFKNETQNQAYKARVEKDLREAMALQVQGTPTLFFNGKQIELGSVDKIKQQAEPLYIK
jgi:protein-disulfide isomerase